MSTETSDTRMVIVDVETTGVYNADRIVEIAVVTVDAHGHICEEYDTLVNPERDVGRTDIHGITASMVSAAPTFDEIAAAVASQLEGAVLVAHNLVFDRRMIGNEYTRAGATLTPGDGICTLRLTGERLGIACARHGIVVEQQHRALADARATAQLLHCVMEGSPTGSTASVAGLGSAPSWRTLRREAAGGQAASAPTPLGRVLAAARYPTSNGNILAYLDMVDWVLDDLVITTEETNKLRQFAYEMGISAEEQRQAHHDYLASLIVGAQRDDIITAGEHRLFSTVADALGLGKVTIPEITQLPSAPGAFAHGTRVCFTGTAVDADGNKIGRSELEALAARMGLQPVSGVSKKNCDLLVAADPSSASGKAKKARSYSIPVMNISDFLARS